MTNDNESMTTQNLWNVAKAILRMKFTVIQSDFLDIVIKKILKQANFTSKGTKQEQTKPKVS